MSIFCHSHFIYYRSYSNEGLGKTTQNARFLSPIFCSKSDSVSSRWDTKMGFFFFNEIMSLESTWWHRDYHTKWSQKQKDTIWHHLYLEYKTGHKWTYLWNRNRFTNIETRLVVGVRVGGEKVWEFGISRYKPLYMGWISNKILIYSTGNYIQYP